MLDPSLPEPGIFRPEAISDWLTSTSGGTRAFVSPVGALDAGIVVAAIYGSGQVNIVRFVRQYSDCFDIARRVRSDRSEMASACETESE